MFGERIISAKRDLGGRLNNQHFFMSDIKDVKCVTVQFNYSFTIILSMSGELYLVGNPLIDNHDGLSEPVKYLDNIKEIISAELQIVVLGHDGNFYSMNNAGDLPYSDVEFELVSVYYQQKNIAKYLKAFWNGLTTRYLTKTGELLVLSYVSGASKSELILTDTNVTLFFVAEFEGDEELFYAKSEVLYAQNRMLKWEPFTLDSKIVKMRMTQPNQNEYALYILTESGTMYLYGFVNESNLPKIDAYKKMGQVSGEEEYEAVDGDFTLAPIPILNNIYNFDLFAEQMGLIADRIKTVDL